MDAITKTSWVDLSSRQLSIWLEVQSSGHAASYQIGGFTRIARPIDPERFRRAVGLVVSQHEALRLEISANAPRQRVRESVPDPVELIDLSGEANPEEAFLALADRDFVTPMSLSEVPLLRISLVRIADDVWYSLLRCHHLIMDGLSVPLLLSRISQAYDALGTNQTSELPSSTYLDFVSEDAAYLSSGRAERDVEFWQRELADLPPPVLLPRAGAEASEGAASSMLLRWELGRAHYGRFVATCETLKLRPMPALVALAASLVNKLAENDDVVLGIAVPGRGRSARNKLGMFNGAMPLRLHVDRADSLAGLAGKASERLTRGYRTQRATVDSICRALEVSKKGRRGIFEVFLSYIPAEVSTFTFTLDGVELAPVILRGPEANPLAIYISESREDQPVLVEFAFNPAYLDREAAQLLMERFQRLITRFTADPHAKVESLNLFDAAERARVRQESAGGAALENARRVRILASFTADPLAGPLRFWLDTLRLPATIEVAEYNVLFQELLNPKSGTRTNTEGANLVLLRVEDWMRFREDGASDGAEAFVRETAQNFLDALGAAAQSAKAPFLLALCAPSPAWDEGGAEAHLQAAAEAVLSGAASLPGVTVIDYRETRRLYPAGPEWDQQSDGLGHVPLTSDAFTATATLIARRLSQVLRRKAKVVVVDCDNTLWGGVVGEDGVEGIRLAPAHLALQQRLVEAAAAGMLVCLCSKNAEEDVLAVLDQRADMVLRREHLVTHRINWHPKSQNIRSIAKELDLGLDSFVFLDDNPVEIAEVEAACPEVLSLPFVAEGQGATRAEHIWPLDAGAATAEDKKRTRFYRENAERTKLLEKTGDFSSFIASLGLEIRIEAPRDEHLARLEQLTERTTQFNINGIRRAAGEFACADGKSAARAVFVKDRFGDYGLVGALLTRPDRAVLETDTLLMSCRVLGRGVEHSMVAELGRLAKASGCAQVRIVSEVTARNLPVRQFLATLPGSREETDGRIVNLLTAAEAADFAFRPESGETTAASDEAPAAGAATAAPAVSAAVWNHIASALTEVPAIVEAVRAASTVARASATAYRAPRTPLEHELAEELAKLLGLDKVGIDDNLFEVGLHSLLAVQFVAHVRASHNVQLSIRGLFENPTVAALARAVADNDTGEHIYSALVPLQAGDGHDPLFCIHPANGDAVSFMRLARWMGADQTVYGLEASGLAEGEPLGTSIEQMAEDYIAEIKAVRPEGPYNLLGWSFGGPVAYEMARRLAQRGEKVGHLIFMDSPSPYGRDDPNLSYEEVLQIFAEDLESIERRFDLAVTRRKRQVTIQNVIETAQRMGVAPPEYTEAEARRKIAVYTNCVSLFRRWTPRGYDGDILQFRAIKQDPRIPYDWHRHTSGKVTTIKVKCNHVRIGFEPFVVEVARRVRAELKGEKAIAPWWRRALAVVRRPAQEKASLAQHP